MVKRFKHTFHLFGAAKVAKNADPNKYGYNGYSVGFDELPHFS